MDVVDGGGGVDRGRNPRATAMERRDSDDKIAEPSWFSPKRYSSLLTSFPPHLYMFPHTYNLVRKLEALTLWSDVK